MFNLFKKKPKLLREDDKIFMYRRITDQVLVNDLASAAQGDSVLLVVSFFSASLKRIAEMLRQRAVPFAELNTHHLPHLPLNGIPAIQLLDARQVVSNLSLQSWLMKPEASFGFYFIEHYPAFAAEEQVLGILEQASQESPQQVRFYAGLDDRLFSTFNGGSIIQLMQRMGLREDEVIAHPLVTKSIANAQKKIGKKVANEFPAASEEEWFAKNIPAGS